MNLEVSRAEFESLVTDALDDISDELVSHIDNCVILVEEVVRQVHITVVHEIAHHFGIDDAKLHELGYA